MLLIREQFRRHLLLGTEAIRSEIARYCWNEIPTLDRYYIILNGSYDKHPLAPGEYFFPDHGRPQTDRHIPRSAEEVVERLWRDGKIPAWIDITPYEVDGTCLYSELLCCGRFTDQENILYHQREGYPPFHKFGPILPVGYRDLEQDGKFDLNCYRDQKKSSPPI